MPKRKPLRIKKLEGGLAKQARTKERDTNDEDDVNETGGSGCGNDSKQEGEQIDDEDDDEDGEIRMDGRVSHEDIAVTFEYNDMRSSYSEGVKLLLRTLLVNPTLAYQAACAITAQVAAGTAISCEGEEDVFAFSSVLPLCSHKTGPLLQIVDSIRNAANSLPQSAAGKAFAQALSPEDEEKTGIFVHARISNLPLKLVGPVHRNLLEDLAWTRTHRHEVEGARELAAVTQVLLLAPCVRPFAEKGRKLQAVEDVTGDATLLLDLFDDEIFLQDAAASLLFKPSHAAVHVVAALIPVSSLDKAVQSIIDLAGAS